MPRLLTGLYSILRYRCYRGSYSLQGTLFQSLWFTLFGVRHVVDKLPLNTTDGSRKDKLYSAKESLPRLFFHFCTLENATHGSKYTQTFFTSLTRLENYV